MVGRFEYGFVIKALEKLRSKNNRGAYIFFTFILFPSHFSLSLSFFFILPFFLTFLSFS
jgi:hypothetical protein